MFNNVHRVDKILELTITICITSKNSCIARKNPFDDVS